MMECKLFDPMDAIFKYLQCGTSSEHRPRFHVITFSPGSDYLQVLHQYHYFNGSSKRIDPAVRVTYV